MKLIGYLFFIFLFSCAWNKQEIRTIKRKKQDIIKDFEIDNKLARKFLEKVEPVPELEPKTEVDTKDEAENNKNKKIAKKKVSKKIPKKLKKVKKVKQEVVVANIVKKAKKIKRPEDYPKVFEEYNNKYAKVWKNNNPRIFVGEEQEIDVKYFNVTAGKVILRTLPLAEIGNKDAYHFRADLKSAPFYSYVYRLDDYLETFWDVNTLLPLKFTLIQRESGQEVDDLQIFDTDELKTYFFYKRLKKGKIKKEQKQSYTPAFFQDSFSALAFARGLPLKNNDVYEFPIITRTKVWLVKIKVKKREKIKIGKKEYNAIKIDAETRFPGILKKKGDINFWFSDDKYRKILKFEAKVKLGTIYGQLARYKAGEDINN